MSLLRNGTTNRIVATRVDRLSGFFQRAVGLLARNSLAPDEGVWIAPCNAIHTIGMRIAIDVIFVDANGRVLRLEPEVRPNRLALACGQAQAVIELGYGALSDREIAPGDYLELV